MTSDGRAGGDTPLASPIVLDTPAHLQRWRCDLERLVEVAEGALDADVVTCPGWTVRRLAAHLTRVYAFVGATHEARAVDAPVRVDPPSDDDGVLDLLAATGAEVAARLRAGGDDHPLWSWTSRRDAGFWVRRLAHETTLHRIDVEVAAGVQSSPVEPVDAADGIDEWLTTYVIGRGVAASLGRPGASVHLHCTDVDGEWTLRIPAEHHVASSGTDAGDETGGVTLERGHTKGDAAARGPADPLWRTMTGRAVDPAGSTAAGGSPAGGSVEVLGDAELVWALVAAGT